MKQTKAILAYCLIVCFYVCACGSQGAGPKTWIDLPLDDTIAPLAPLILMAHSSDISGVKSIEFFVNDEKIVSQGAEGNRLESRRYEWTPPEPGKYTIKARGINGAGEEGSFAIASITILGEDYAQPQVDEMPTGTPTITSTGSLIPTITASVTSTPSATITPSMTITPSVTIKPSYTPTNTPKVEIIEPPVIEIDTTDPIIVSVNASPDPIYHEVCGNSFDLVVRLTVNATDNVAMDHVGGTWSIGGESGDYILNHVGGSQYQKDFGPFTALGPLYFVGSAEDTSGNWTYYEAWVTIKNCID